MKRAIALAIAIAAIAFGGTSTAGEPVQFWASQVAAMKAAHPGLIRFHGYHYADYRNGKLIPITGIEAYVKGHPSHPNRACWFIATIGHQVTAGSCKGN